MRGSGGVGPVTPETLSPRVHNSAVSSELDRPGVVPFHRPARSYPPTPPTDDIVVASPPSVAADATGSWLYALAPVLGSGGLVAFAVVYHNRTFLIIAGVLAGISLTLAIAMRFAQSRTARRQRRATRRRYLEHLAAVERDAVDVTTAQRAAASRLFP